MFENIDNRTKILGDDLKKEITENSKVKIAASCFSMYAFKELKEELGKIEELQFLFTSPTFTKDKLADNLKKEKKEFFIPKLSRESSLFGNEFEIKLRNEMTLKAIAKECASWIRQKVQFKSNITDSNIPNIIGIEKEDSSKIIYNPIDGFTTRQLQKLYSFFEGEENAHRFEKGLYFFNDKSVLDACTPEALNALKAKYVRDDYGSPRMIDIIYNTSTKYFLWEYNTSASNVMNIVTDAVLNKKSFTTLYAGIGEAAENNINNFIMECIAAYR